MRPLLDIVTTLFEIVTISTQLLVLIIFVFQVCPAYALLVPSRKQRTHYCTQDSGFQVDPTVPTILLVTSVLVNVAFHFPARHFGLDSQHSLRLAAEELASRAQASFKGRLFASMRGSRSLEDSLTGVLSSGSVQLPPSNDEGSEEELDELEEEPTRTDRPHEPAAHAPLRILPYSSDSAPLFDELGNLHFRLPRLSVPSPDLAAHRSLGPTDAEMCPNCHM